MLGQGDPSEESELDAAIGIGWLKLPGEFIWSSWELGRILDTGVGVRDQPCLFQEDQELPSLQLATLVCSRRRQVSELPEDFSPL